MTEYLIGIILGWGIGWYLAHATIAKECERLGGFYVDNKTYKCTEIIKEKKDDRVETISNVDNP